MNIQQFRYGDTNLAYLLWDGIEAVAVDGGAADEIISFCGENGLNLAYVTNTHGHSDHTPGNEHLLSGTSASLISPEEMCEMKVLPLGSSRLEAFPTPGHTNDSICFYFNDGDSGCLVTGDTLFNGTVGNCYTKNYELYFSSLQKVLRFPSETKIYAGHDIFDYTTGVMDKIDPDNPFLAEYKSLYSKDHLVTALGQELKVNPFIRYNDKTLDAYRSGLGMPLKTEYERWRAMMSVH